MRMRVVTQRTMLLIKLIEPVTECRFGADVRPVQVRHPWLPQPRNGILLQALNSGEKQAVRIFVSGATGFIGAHFIEKALTAGHRVAGLYRGARVETQPL